MSVNLEQLKAFPLYANKSNPIHRAAARSDIEFLQTLRDNLDLKKIKMRDGLGATPLHVAAREERRECLEWLLANTNLSVTDQANAGETPLHVAAARGHISLLQMLVRHAKPDTPEARAAVLLTPDNNRLTALHLAALKGHQSVVNWIVMEYKPYVAPLMETGRVTPAHLAASVGHAEILRTLLSSSNRFNGWAEARDTEGTPIAYFAAQEGKLDCLRFLLEELSADPKAVASEGMTAMHAAAQSGHDVIIRYYVERLGSDVINWRTVDGGIPLHFAAGMGHSSTVALLLGYDETGMSVTATDDKLVTPLHETLQLGKVGCARILIDAGADVTAEDSSGRSALSVVTEDAFHPCHAVVMQTTRGSVSEESDEEPVRNRIPKARSCIEEVQPDILAEDPEPVDRASLHSTHSAVLSSHSSKTTLLSDNHSQLSSRRSSLAEHSYSLSPLLTEPPPPATAQLDKFLVGMGRRTARRQLRWLARSAKVPAPLSVPEEPDPPPPTFQEQIQLASERLQPSAAEAPKRQMGSLVLERMHLLGGSVHQVSKPQPEVPLFGEESAEPFVYKDDLPADLPVSEELQFFYGKERDAVESQSESTLLSEGNPTPDPVEGVTPPPADVATPPDQSGSSLSESVESVSADDVTAQPDPALGLPEPGIVPGDLTEDKPKKSRFSGLRLIGRLLGRKDREEDGVEGATFEAIMQRNLIIQEQLRSTPYPLLPLEVLEPISASTGLREPVGPPVWRPEELLMEERRSDSPEPPTSTTDTSPNVTARLIRPTVEQSRPVSTTIHINVAAPHVLTEPPSFPFTTKPAETQDTPTHDPETFLYGRRPEKVSDRIADLTQSLLGAAAPVRRPYTPHAVYQSSQPIASAKPAEPKDTARAEVQEVPVPPLKPEAKERSVVPVTSHCVTTGYDVPSWEEAREYLRRVTARQARGPQEEEEAVPLVRDEEETQEPKLTVEPPSMSQSPVLSDNSAVTRPSPGSQVSRLKEKFSEVDPIRPQHLRTPVHKSETLQSPPNPGKPFQNKLEMIPAATRPVRHSLAVKKLPAVREEVPNVSDLLRDMLLSKACPGDEVASKPGLPAAEGEPVGRDSLRSEVQELSLSGQVRDRLKRLNPGS